MTANHRAKRQALKEISIPTVADAGLSMLAVGDVALWRDAGHPLPADTNIKFADLSEIDGAYLTQMQPDIVVAPLVTSSFDCVDLAARLSEANFEGRFRILTAFLPNPAMVHREMSTQFPNLDFDLIVLKQGQVPRLN